MGDVEDFEGEENNEDPQPPQDVAPEEGEVAGPVVRDRIARNYFSN